MSEYTTVYLRHKNMPLLKKKEHPSHEECQSQSKEDLMKVIREIDEYNKQVAKSLGCKLFYLTTTPSRELRRYCQVGSTNSQNDRRFVR